MTILAPPGKYLVWSDEQDVADARAFDATSPEHAAELWAERKDRQSAEYRIARGNEQLVTVRNDDRKEWRFVVYGEAVPSYWATPA